MFGHLYNYILAQLNGQQIDHAVDRTTSQASNRLSCWHHGDEVNEVLMSVVVLNADLQLFQHVSLEHSIRMILRGVAEVVESEGTFGSLPRPKIVRLVKYVYIKFREHGSPKCSKTKVLALYNRECCYCGGEATTVDHVLSRARGGQSCWENLVACCIKDNQAKGDRSPEEAGLSMRYQPFIPTYRQLMGRVSAKTL